MGDRELLFLLVSPSLGELPGSTLICPNDDKLSPELIPKQIKGALMRRRDNYCQDHRGQKSADNRGFRRLAE
jgi:hypothetical protein